MRTPLSLIFASLGGLALAQCDFDPIITPSGPTILCPNGSVELSVGDYDAYQWYQGSQPIDNADQPTYTVTYFDSGVEYSVEVTLDGCTEMSPAVLIDGWMFLPPFVIHGGDEPIGTGPMGELTFCEGDTLTLEMGMPYTESISWTNNGITIPDQNDPILVITESGSYSGSGAPLECPNSISQLGVSVEVEFVAPQQPSIVDSGDEICAFPLGTSYTWYLNGVEMAETTACITPTSSGPYTVFVEYGQDCEVISEPYLITGVHEQTADRPWTIYPNPGNGQMNFYMDPSIGTGAYYSVLDAIGKEVAGGWMPLNGLLQLDLAQLAPGTYLFQAAKDGKALAPASRFAIVK